MTPLVRQDREGPLRRAFSRDGKTFYMASNRAGGLGGIDIWVSRRASGDDPLHLFSFVSNRAGGCGGDDIYTTRLRPDGWDPVENLGCELNSSANKASPFPLPERAEGPVLYFSSTRSGGGDLFRSVSHGGVFGHHYVTTRSGG